MACLTLWPVRLYGQAGLNFFILGPGHFLGFGPGLSILTALTKKRFSYCLPLVERPTSLRFGDNDNIRGPRSKIQTTSLVPNVGNYYVAQMLGISIEEKRLNINPYLFKLKNDMRGGFGVDSGRGVRRPGWFNFP